MNPYLEELRKDETFKKYWPYVAVRLEKFLLGKQHEFALKHDGQFQRIGEYVSFQAQLFDDLEEVHAVAGSASERPTRKRLNNTAFKTTP